MLTKRILLALAITNSPVAGAMATGASCGDDTGPALQRLRKAGIRAQDMATCEPPKEAGPAPAPLAPPKLPAPRAYPHVSVSLAPGEPQVQLKYDLLRAEHPATGPRKTVVFFGGGPNPTLGHPQVRQLVPADYDVLVLEYPGIGENAGIKVNDPDKVFSIEGHARYATALIEKLGIKDYSIMGHSYGTRVATQAAAALTGASASKIPPPKGVLLDAVGTSGGEWGSERAKATDELALSEDLKAQLKTKMQGLKKTAGDNHFIDDLLIMGVTTRPKEEGLEFLKWFLKESDQKLLGCVKSLMEDMKKSKRAPAFDGVSRCQTHQPASAKPVAYFGGAITADLLGTRALCACSRSKVKGQWRVPQVNSAQDETRHTALFYRNGGNDDTTPLKKAREEHFDKQRTGRKAFFSDPDGGHEAFFSLHPACAGRAWPLVFGGERGLESWSKTMSSCSGGLQRGGAPASGEP